jgi:ABC-2 type transport system ATP-binding protein
MTSYVLDAISTGKSYDDLVALHDCTIGVEPGELVALIGHNGSGKSTFMKLAAGMLEATTGSIEVKGAPAGSLIARAALSYIPDDPVLYDDLSVFEHVEYLARLHPDIGDWERRAADLVVRLNLEERVDGIPARFSRGLRQKTSLLLGLVRPFDVLLIDEPFVGLDPAGQRTALDLMMEQAERGAAVVVATHQMTFLEVATRGVVLRDGALIHDGKIDRDHVDDLLAE